MQNKDGQFVQPDDTTFQAAAAGADWNNAPASTRSSPNQPGKNAWPITGASFILMHVKQDKPQNAAEVLKFFDWAFNNGQKMADGARLRAAAGRGHQGDRGSVEGADQGRASRSSRSH